jgi:hypothetical protein
MFMDNSEQRTDLEALNTVKKELEECWRFFSFQF